MKNKPEYILDRNYQLGNNSVLRQLNHLRRMQFSTMGWYHNGPGLKNLCVLCVYHYLGSTIFRVYAWIERHPRLNALVGRLLPRR